MKSISIEEYEKMTEKEKLLYFAKYLNVTEQDIIPAAEALSKAFQEKKLSEKKIKLVKKILRWETVNKNPLAEIHTPEMRLYHV